MPRKTNPRRRPLTEAELRRGVHEATRRAFRQSTAITFTVLLDKFGWTGEQLQEMWTYINALCDEIGERRVSISDLMRVLKDEYNIRIGG